MDQVKPKPGLARRSLTSVSLALGIFIAIEVGLRLNESLQGKSTTGPLSVASDFTVVSFGDSISAGFPSILESKLNQTPSVPRSRVINLYQTAPIKGSLQNTVLSAIPKHRPNVALIMLGAGDFGTKPSSVDLLPQSIWAKNSLLVRVIFVKLYPLLKKIDDWRQTASSRELNPSLKFELSRDGLNKLVDDLLNKTCCVESGFQQIADRQRNLQQFDSIDVDLNQRRLADFLIQLLSHQFDQAEKTLVALKETAQPLSIPPADLEAALRIEQGDADGALAEQRRRLEQIALSEFGCSTAINTASVRNDSENEFFFVQKCAKDHPNSNRMKFHSIDLQTRRKNREGVMSFIKTLPDIDESSQPRIVARIYYIIASYFYHRHELTVAKKYFEKSLELDPKYQRSVDYYLTAITSLRKDGQKAPIPEKLLSILVPNSRYRLFESQNGLPVSSPAPLESNSVNLKASTAKDRVADFPISYISMLNQLCRNGVETFVLNYPLQPLGPVQRGLSSVPCLRFVDLQRSIQIAMTEQGYRNTDLFQTDGLHLTAKGDDVVATSICEAIAETFSPAFSKAGCRSQTTRPGP